MNGAEVLRRLNKERRDWSHGGDGVEVNWTLRGMDIAFGIIYAIAKEEQAAMQLRRPKLSRWMAGDMYNAIGRALSSLRRGERAKAVAILQDAADAAQKNRQRAHLENGSLTTHII